MWYRIFFFTCLLIFLCCSQSNEERNEEEYSFLSRTDINWDSLPLQWFLPPDGQLVGIDRGWKAQPKNLRSRLMALPSSIYETVKDFLESSKSPEHQGSIEDNEKYSFSPHRQLQTKGTNCILIERGTVPRYYDCNGCVIDRAQGCIDDLRLNRSLNLPPECAMKSASVRYLSSCCPQITLQNGRYNLQYLSAGYPMALRCLQQVQCGGSVLFQQLEKECKHTCPMYDPRTGGSVCYANFNAAGRVHGLHVWNSVFSLVGIGIASVWLVL